MAHPRQLFPGLLLILFAFLAGGNAGAQWGAPRVVTSEARLEPAEGRRGAAVTLVVTATVDEQYHLYSMWQPTDKPGPIATEITLAEDATNKLIEAGPWKEPEVTVKFDQGFEMQVGTLYGSPLEFRREYRISPDLEPGEFELSGIFLFQACTETSCLPPMEQEFTAALTVLEGEAEEIPAAILAGDFDGEPVAPEDAPAQTARAGSTADIVGGSSFLGFIIAAFLLGVIALATPCVFPMIPITITFFTGKQAKTTAHAVGAAAVYVLSIILGFTIIGFGFSLLLLLAGAGVERSGFANMIAANPWINLSFALLYIVFALGLFGAFEFRLPSSLSNRLNQSATASSGVVSIFFKAMVFVVISFTCTAPLLGVLIVQTLQGEWTRPLFGMMAFATGFALPFFVLALVPQMLGNLPRAGAWLYVTKIVMGLIVLAAAFKFLSNTDLVWFRERMLLTREVLLAIWATIAAVIAFYMWGFVRLKEEGETEGIGTPRLLMGTGFGALALYLASGLFGGSLHTWIEAYMPPDLRPGGSMVASAGGGQANTTDPKALYRWFDNVDDAVVEARATGRNIFLDFTGYTCTNCRLMEKEMFPRPDVSRLMGEYVLVQLYTDDREVGRKWQGYQAQMFNTVTLPFYAIITPDEDILATEEYTRDERRFVEFLRSGLTESQRRNVAQAPPPA